MILTVLSLAPGTTTADVDSVELAAVLAELDTNQVNGFATRLLLVGIGPVFELLQGPALGHQLDPLELQQKDLCGKQAATGSIG